MNKKIAVLLAALMLICSGIAMAEEVDPSDLGDDVIDGAEMQLGGIRIGMEASEVEHLLGAPAEHFTTERQPVPNIILVAELTYVYGTGLRIDFDGRYVTRLRTGEPGIPTAAGIEVGDTVEKMQSVYGQGVRSSDNGAVTFEYYNMYPYEDVYFFNMEFTTKDGVITEIVISEPKVY